VLACTPHPGLGTVVVRHALIDLRTCLTATAPVPSSQGPRAVGRRIVFHGKVVVTARKGDGILPEGASPDGRWILYAADPLSSASIAADGLPVRVVGAGGGRSYAIATGLVYRDYRSWCDGRLVTTAGSDRTTTTHKWLVTSSPPAWRTQILVEDAHRAFGSLACAGDGVIVQSTAASARGFRSSHWALWKIGWDGKATRLTHPPAGYSDDSPQVSADGRTVYFVRSKNDHGTLYALQNGRLVGPLLSLDTSPGYFGHRDWPYRVTR
jgi:Tol biopolymer transport system component